MKQMHADEVPIDDRLVRQLLQEQFPQWADLPLVRVEPAGTDNAIYRLGADKAVRLPRRNGSDVEEDKEHEWLPRLAPLLPLEVPLPLARGRPGGGYQWFWSIVTWVEGDSPLGETVAPDELADFLAALWQVDPGGAPQPGSLRGDPLVTRDLRVQQALDNLDVPGAKELWEHALRARAWPRAPVWLHADLDARNVLARDGRLTGVVDWGCMGVGDPAVDVMAAFKLLDADGREWFRRRLEVDDDTWLRAEGWALSQALIALDYYTLETNPTLVREANNWLRVLLSNSQ